MLTLFFGFLFGTFLQHANLNKYNTTKVNRLCALM